MNDQTAKVQLNKASLAEQIYEVLKERIINLGIQPGERIDIDAIREEFEVSRAPIRDALQRLVDKGLVKVKPRVGYFAVKLTPKEIKDIYAVRKLFETYALSKSIEKIPTSKLEELREESLRLREDGIPYAELQARFDETDKILHQDLILQYAENELLHDFTKRINNLIAIIRHLNERIKEAIEEHLVLIDALLKGNQDEAEEALCGHLDQVEQEILRVSIKSPLLTDKFL